MKLRIKSPGSGGELIQGTINGEPFLVTCPIDLYAEAVLSAKQSLSIDTKALQALTKTLAYLGNTKFPYGIELASMLPQGKGLSSSSADIAAVCQITALALGHKLTEQEIAAIAISIEPTDGVFCEGIVQFNHLTGIIKNTWRFIPKLTLALFDCGGSVDTLTFNKRQDLKTLNLEKEATIVKALNLLNQGLRENNPQLIGKAATLSAFANQKILYKKPLTKIYDIAMQSGAVGINIAHSGTIIGMLFEADKINDLLNSISVMHKICPEVSFLKTVNMISGGLRIEEFNYD